MYICNIYLLSHWTGKFRFLNGCISYILYVMNATLYYDSAYPANSAYVYGFGIGCHHLQHCSLHRKLFQKSLKLLCKIFRLNVLMWDMYISYKWSLLLPLKNIWWIWNTNVLQIKCSGGFLCVYVTITSKRRFFKLLL